MQTGEILLLATVAIVVLGGLVALGIGHRRWSIGTVVAGFLVLLSATTFVYLAARLADRERRWADRIDDYKNRIAKADEDRSPDATGTLLPVDGGPRSLARLRQERDRWRRGRDRIDTWRGRAWQGAEFDPPPDEQQPGRVLFAAEQGAEDSPPIGVGAHIYLFDSAPFEQGGRYIGEFLVRGTGYDADSKRHSLEVVQAAPRDAYDTQVLGRRHDAVTVFESLPVDRWLAFYRTRDAGAAAPTAPLPDQEKQDPALVGTLLGEPQQPEVAALVKRFVESFRQHEEEVPDADWEAAAKEAMQQPGTLWAVVAFTKPHSFGAAAPEAPANEGPKRDYEPGDRAEFDLQTAVELRDAGAVDIERVVRRRPLTDALALLHGSAAGPGGSALVDGSAAIMLRLQAELANLERANTQLRAAQQAATTNGAAESQVVDELRRDLESWKRDVRAATELAAGFEQELGRTTRALRDAERAIVDRGRELSAAFAKLTREIDRVAPPPERRAAKP